MKNKLFEHTTKTKYTKKLVLNKNVCYGLKKTKWYKNIGFVVVSKCSLKEELCIKGI